MKNIKLKSVDAKYSTEMLKFNFMPVPSIHTNNCHGILLVSKCNNILLTLMKPELSNWPLRVEIFRQHACQRWKINRWIWAQAGKENWKQQICFNIEIKISSRVSKLCYKPKTAKPRMSWYQATPRVSNINHLKWIGVFFSQERKIKEKRNNLGNYFTVTKRESISRRVFWVKIFEWPASKLTLDEWKRRTYMGNFRIWSRHRLIICGWSHIDL